MEAPLQMSTSEKAAIQGGGLWGLSFGPGFRMAEGR